MAEYRVRQQFTLFLLITTTSLSVGSATLAASYQGKIVNGTQASEGEFPFAVSLRRSGRHSCGASLLNRAWVLTAAHCVARTEAAKFEVQYGSVELMPFNRTVDSDSAANTGLVGVGKIFVHPGYDPHNQHIHDIALLKLSVPVPGVVLRGAESATVRLPGMQQATPGDLPVTLIGWGLNATGGSVQRHLQKVQLQTFTDEECLARHQTVLHPETTLCAGVAEGGKGQCGGDSGGPLLVNGTNLVIGIVSWSRKPCTTPPYPGVFTEVAAYVDWILDTVGDETVAVGAANDNEEEESLEELQSGNLIIVRKRDPLAAKQWTEKWI